MVEGEIIVKVVPDTKVLDKELKKKRTFAGLLGFGGARAGAEEGKKEGAKEGSKGIISQLKNMGKSVGITAVIIGALWNFIKPVLEIVKAISALLFLAFSPILLPAFKLLVKMLPFLRKIADFIKAGLEKLIGFFKAGVGFVIDFFKAVWSGITKAWDILKAGGKWLWDNIIVKGFKILLGIGEFIWDLVVGGFEFLFKIGKFLFDSVINGFKVLFKVGENIWNNIKKSLNFISDLGSRIWGVIKDALSGVKDLIVNGFKSLMNAVIRFVNKIIPGKRFDIPLLANGGIITKPTLAVIGERGPEAVIPLGRGGGFGGMGVTQNISINATINNDMDIRVLANRLAELSKDELAMSTGSQRF